MAAAALAYKCIEVAYMKVAYYKHSAASKDRHELLTALQTVMPGYWNMCYSWMLFMPYYSFFTLDFACVTFTM